MLVQSTKTVKAEDAKKNAFFLLEYANKMKVSSATKILTAVHAMKAQEMLVKNAGGIINANEENALELINAYFRLDFVKLIPIKFVKASMTVEYVRQNLEILEILVLGTINVEEGWEYVILNAVSSNPQVMCQVFHLLD